MSHVWEEGGRENWLVNIAWMRACVKAGLLDHLISKNASQNKDWKTHVNILLF